MTELRKIYTARVIENVETKPGCWHHQRVGVYENDRKIGEYIRNYSHLYDTFEPFEHKGKLYALYSRDYTSTRVMTLPDCKDWCGEKPCGFGFCPVDFYVPERKEFSNINDLDEVKNSTYYDEFLKENEFIEKYIGCFGFVAGCVWGDDSSWKIQYLDLSRIEEKILVREARFGYVELPYNVNRLKDAIDLDNFCGDSPGINVSCHTRFYLDQDYTGLPEKDEPETTEIEVSSSPKSPKEGIWTKIKVKVSDFITEISNRR